MSNRKNYYLMRKKLAEFRKASDNDTNLNVDNDMDDPMPEQPDLDCSVNMHIDDNQLENNDTSDIFINCDCRSDSRPNSNVPSEGGSDVEDNDDNSVASRPNSNVPSEGGLEVEDAPLPPQLIVISEDSLKDVLQNWYLSNNVTLTSFRSLLHGLHKFHPDLPLDPRTVLQAKNKSVVMPIGTGEYAYFGLEDTMVKSIDFPLDGINTLKLDINIDGCQVFKSKSSTFWPILCTVSNSVGYKPNSTNVFLVGIYYGMSKPPIHEYLENFCLELNELIEHGITIVSKHYDFEVRSVIADAPARALIKQIIQHNGYYACERCTIPGKWKNGSMTLDNVNCQKRTPHSFINQTQKKHHVGMSPFLNVTNLNMISQFPLDYMHLVLLGVTKTLLKIWLNKVPHKLSQNEKIDVNSKIMLVRKYLPKEFNRLPRILNEADRYKATELRTLLLYSGAIIFHDILSAEYYNHFLLLMYAIRIFCDSEFVLVEANISYAEMLCKTFVEQYGLLYKLNTVYNIHNLIHLADDCRKYGVLDSVSAFPFENEMANLNRNVRTGSRPLAQIVARVAENSFSSNVSTIPKHDSHDRFYFGGHIFIPKQKKNSCVLLKNGDIGLIQGRHNDSIELNKFQVKQSALSYPCDSALLDIYLVKNKTEKITINLNEIDKKCFICPFKSHMLVIPLIQ